MALFMGSGRVVPVTMTHFINNQSKSGFIPSTESIIVTPDYGYTGLGQVIVEAIPSAYVLPSGTYNIILPDTYDIKSYANVSIKSCATVSDPLTISLNLSNTELRFDANGHIGAGFLSNVLSFSSSYQLPTLSGQTIIPNDTVQTINNYQWTLESIICEAIPNNITIYKKIYERTVNDDELNDFLSNKTSIASYMFVAQPGLSSMVIGSNISSIGIGAFYGCSSLRQVSFNNLTLIPSSCFNSCLTLTSAYLPNVTEISDYAFSYCRSLTTVYAPNVSIIRYGVFYGCSNLSIVSFPQLKSVNQSFSNCGLTRIDFPLLSSTGTYEFYNTKPSYVNLPNLTYLGAYAFSNCNNSEFTNIILSKCSFIGDRAFNYCSSLQTVSLPLVEQFSGTSNFAYCKNLISIYLMNSVVASMSKSNIFYSTPIASSSFLGYFGSIYVPSSLLTSYQTHSMWSYYSDRFVGI